MQKEEYLIKNACYSVTKYYLCKQNNKRSLLGRIQRLEVVRSFPNRYQFSCINKVTSLFSDRYIFIIILACKTAAFGMQNNRFCNTLVINRLDKNCVCKKYLHFYHLLFVRLHFSNSILILLHKYSMERFPFLGKMNYFCFFQAENLLRKE